MDLELPRIHRNGATGMNQEPCGSENAMASCASDGTTGFGLGASVEQAAQPPNDDEERLEQMVHPKKTKVMWTPLERWNGLAWVCTPLAMEKGEWTCWGLYGMAMERSCSLWRRREFWDHSVPPNTTRSTRLSLCGCDRTTSISSLRASYGNINESAQTDDLPRQPSKKYSTEADVSHIVIHRSRCFAHRSSRARGLIRGWIQTAWRMDALTKKSHQRSQSTGCVLVRKAPTTLTQSGNSQTSAPQAKDRGSFPR